MGPFEDIGPYAEMAITTRKTDVKEEETDNDGSFADVLIGLFMLVVAITIFSVIGHEILHYAIGLALPSLTIGPLWLGRYLGNTRPLCYRTKLTPDQRAIIKRRLSDHR